jgi:type IV pilus secretin PilQ/predicted competence protein
MRHRKRLLAVFLLLSVGYVMHTGLLKAFSIVSPKEQDLTQIFQIIAIAGKFNVVVDPRIRQKMVLTLKDVEPLEALYTVAKLNGLKIKELRNKGGSLTYAIAPQEIIEKNFEAAFTRSFQLRYAKAEDVANIVAKGLGKDVSIGVEKDARTNSLILRGSEEVLDRVNELIKTLDLPVPQVLIDAKVVTVQTTFTRNLGFVWNFGVGQRADGNVNEKTAGSGGIFAITEFQRQLNNGPFYDSPASPAKGSPLFAFGDFFRANYFLNSAFAALEASGITRTLSSPRLLAINGTQAQLRIGDKIVFTGGPSQPPEERDTGTVMDITPRINKDNFITMDINVEQSAARFDRGDFPTITRTNAKTTVQVKDGEEVLVGGLVQENSAPNTIIVPFLGEIPLIKHFFRRKNNQNTSLELVILLTPRVIKQQAPDPGEVSPPPISSGRGEAPPPVIVPGPPGPAGPGAAPIIPPPSVPPGAPPSAGPPDPLSDINDVLGPGASPGPPTPNGAPLPILPAPRAGLEDLGF